MSLDGDIGVLGNGAGLVMSTLDLIAAAGGRPANFCDVGGGAREAQIAAALELVLGDERVKAVLVNIFGGITRCDEVARGLVDVVGTGARPPAAPPCRSSCAWTATTPPRAARSWMGPVWPGS